MERTAADWHRILTDIGAKDDVAARWAPVFETFCQANSFSGGEQELAEFLGQCAHESGMFTRLEENLSYSSAERLCRVWPSRFRTVAEAQPFVRNPRALANKVYGGRMGNELPDDGYDCRGSGLIQVTGLNNLTVLCKAVGYTDPRAFAEAMRTDPIVALVGAFEWWEANIDDSVIGNIEAETRQVNGGLNGLDERIELISRACRALGLA